MKDKQMPEALRLANSLVDRVAITSTGLRFDGDLAYAAAELRRQYAELEQLRAEVEALRKSKFRGPTKFAPEEKADGNRGIRWICEDGVYGRPTDHDVREYLLRTETARGCSCEECKSFYPDLQIN